ncbi:hypothetical protein GC167_05985 [bacterium]|nr:hypothetical protein [bacterium]
MEASHRPVPLSCEICDAESKLMLDHDHCTGKVRGWLCNRCNSIIGGFEAVKRSPRALAYLDKLYNS